MFGIETNYLFPSHDVLKFNWLHDYLQIVFYQTESVQSAYKDVFKLSRRKDLFADFVDPTWISIFQQGSLQQQTLPLWALCNYKYCKSLIL
jgi:hypothetical protein